MYKINKLKIKNKIRPRNIMQLHDSPLDAVELQAILVRKGVRFGYFI